MSDNMTLTANDSTFDSLHKPLFLLFLKNTAKLVSNLFVKILKKKTKIQCFAVLENYPKKKKRKKMESLGGLYGAFTKDSKIQTRKL